MATAARVVGGAQRRVRIHFCGVRGSTPAPGVDFVRYGGHTSCVAVSVHGREPSLLLDAGTGMTAAASLLDGGAFTGTVLLTHLHWDHTHGMPFFGPGIDPDSRIEVLIPEQGDAVLAELDQLDAAAGHQPPLVSAP